jgi:hypothetical protein
MQAYLRRDATGHHRILEKCFDLRRESWRPVADVLNEIRGTPRATSSAPLASVGDRSFEIECSGCHTSGARLRLDPGTAHMESSWRDAAIDCEACHGPGKAHGDAWAKLDPGQPLAKLETLSPRAATAVCARCHGGPPTAGDWGPADAPHFVTVLEDRDGLFADGTASGQVYQYPGFVRSPCYREGKLTCTGCHEAHGPELRRAGHPDALCSRCHEDKRGRAHTHHDARKHGARCVACHMPRLLDGLMAHQRDHRISSPLPQSPFVPDACTACHKDKDKAWASRAYEDWWGEPDNATLSAIRAVHLARRNAPEAKPLLKRARHHPDPFFRAAAALYLEDPALTFDDSVPEVRLAGVKTARRSKEQLQRFAKDSEPRIRAAARLALIELGEPAARIDREDLACAVRQVRDLSLARVLLGTLQLADGEASIAVRNLEEAVVFRPGLTDAWHALARAYEQTLQGPNAQKAHAQRARLLFKLLLDGYGSPEILEQTVSAYLDAGLPDDARLVLRQAVQRAPPGPMRRRAVALLERFRRKYGDKGS